MQDRETALASGEPDGTGKWTPCHTLPFQVAARSPTARQDVRDRHLTSNSTEPMLCVPDGVGRMTQDLPFHVSPSDRKPSLLVRESPTALQKACDRQDTPSRALPATCRGV